MLKLVSMISSSLLAGIFGLFACAPEPIASGIADSIYATPLPAPEGPLSVYHIGHSLVGRDMPAMLAQLAGEGHRFESQLGWGTPLRHHWETDIPVKGHESENDHMRYREAHEAVGSGEYDVLVVTEAVEIRASLEFHASWDYLARWAKAARAANPEIRIYLYETWHNTDDPEGWMERIDADLEKYWEREIIDRAMAIENVAPVYVVPGGQVLARFLREVEKRGEVGGIREVSDLFTDTIHFNDKGAYLMALVHYSVIYGKSPVGLPHELERQNGQPAQAPSAEAAQLMQEVVWDVVTRYPRTGVAQQNR